MYGYLQHGEGAGPFLTQKVRIQNEHGDKWLAWYEGKWRRVHVQLSRLYIVYLGEKITVQIEGV